MAKNVGASAKMEYTETVVVLIDVLLKHLGWTQKRLVLKLQLVDVIDDYLVFRLLLVLLINKRHEVDILPLIVDLHERKSDILVFRGVLEICNSIKRYLFKFMLRF